MVWLNQSLYLSYFLWLLLPVGVAVVCMKLARNSVAKTKNKVREDVMAAVVVSAGGVNQNLRQQIVIQRGKQL